MSAADMSTKLKGLEKFAHSKVTPSQLEYLCRRVGHEGVARISGLPSGTNPVSLIDHSIPRTWAREPTKEMMMRLGALRDLVDMLGMHANKIHGVKRAKIARAWLDWDASVMDDMIKGRFDLALSSVYAFIKDYNSEEPTLRREV